MSLLAVIEDRERRQILGGWAQKNPPLHVLSEQWDNNYGLDFSMKFKRSPPPCEISDSPLENVQVSILGRSVSTRMHTASCV